MQMSFSFDQVSASDAALVRAYVESALPRNVPSYVRSVVSLRTVPVEVIDRKVSGLEVEIETVDGGRMLMTVAGRVGAACYSWRMLDGGGPLYWCHRKRVWRRDPKRYEATKAKLAAAEHGARRRAA